jgi:hypothetical protein
MLQVEKRCYVHDRFIKTGHTIIVGSTLIMVPLKAENDIRTRIKNLAVERVGDSQQRRI